MRVFELRKSALNRWALDSSASEESVKKRLAEQRQRVARGSDDSQVLAEVCLQTGIELTSIPKISKVGGATLHLYEDESVIVTGDSQLTPAAKEALLKSDAAVIVCWESALGKGEEARLDMVRRSVASGKNFADDLIVKIKFEADQAFQLNAIHAVTELFHGQPSWSPRHQSRGKRVGLASSYSNRLGVSEKQIFANLRSVQEANGIKPSDKLDGLNFSVSMETGTGKTYVYLRTIFELHRQYQFSKFIIVVPSVAIREGVLQNVRITASHMDGIYGRVLREFRVFSPDRLGNIRQFASSENLQVLIMNIDTFNKASNIARRAQEYFGGATTLGVLSNCSPIVVLDEPQNFESELAAAAIKDLGPLCTLRYSATHRREYNLIYRLSPTDAYDLGLVKRIEVLSVRPEGLSSTGSVRLVNVVANRTTVAATLEIDCRRGAQVRQARVKVTRTGDDLFALSGRLPVYRGLQIAGIDAERQQVELSDGTVLTAEAARARIEKQSWRCRSMKPCENTSRRNSR